MALAVVCHLIPQVLARLPPGCAALATTSRGVVGTGVSGPVELENVGEESSLLTPALSLLLVAASFLRPSSQHSSADQIFYSKTQQPLPQIPARPGCRILPFHLAEHLLDPMVQDIRAASPYVEDDQVSQLILELFQCII